MCRAKSRSPRLNHVSEPRRSNISRVLKVSSATPQPVSTLLNPASVYVMVSRSGETCRPWKSSSSPVLTTIASCSGGKMLARPNASFAPPTPPAKANTKPSKAAPNWCARF